MPGELFRIETQSRGMLLDDVGHASKVMECVLAASLPLDVRCPNNGPPFLNFGPLVYGESLWRLLLSWENLLPKFCNPSAQNSARPEPLVPRH